MVANLWDLVDGGIDPSLDTIKAVGATLVTVVVTSPPVLEMRAAAGVTPRIFRSDGGCFYQPDDSFYADTRIKPITASWLKGRNPLESVAESCTRLNLSMNLRISALRIGRVGARHPEAACKTAHGDALPESLCPANPDVRALLRGTVQDLSQRYFPHAIEVADLFACAGPATDSSPRIAFAGGEGFSGLLGLCFCESSRQLAADRGVDAAAAARWVQVKLDRALATGESVPARLSELVADSAVVSAYARLGAESAASLFESLGKGCGCEVDLVVGEDAGFGQPAAGNAVAACPLATDEPFVSFARRTRDRFGAEARVALEFQAADVVAQPQKLVSTVKQAAEEGFSGVSFAHFGVIPPRCLDTIRQAVRFAVRLTS